MRSGIFIVLFIAIMLTIPGLGSKGFSTRGEPREALVAQSIVRGDSWILPEGYGGAIPSKPPTMHWAIALFSLPSGEVSPLTARLPSALAAIAFALGLFLFLRTRTDVATAVLTVLVFMTSIEWARAAVACRVDMLLATTMLGAILLLFCWWERRMSGLPISAMLLLLAATLAKGPVALILPAGSFGAFLLLRKELTISSILKMAMVFAAPFVLSLGWYLAAYQVGGEAFFDKVWSENVARFLGTMEDDPHRATVLYLYGTLFLGLLPWTPLLLLRKWSFPHWLKRPKEILMRFQALAPHEQLFLLTVVTVIGFYSIPSSKRSVYLLPAYPLIAYGIVRALSMADVWLGRRVFALKLLVGLISVIFLAAPVLLLFGGQLPFVSSIADLPNYSTSFVEGLSQQWPMFIIYIAAILLALKVAFAKFERGNLVAQAGVCFGMLLFAANCFLLGFFVNRLSPKEFAQQVAQLVPAEATIYSFGDEAYAMSFYLKRTITPWSSERARPDEYALLFSKNLSKLQKSWNGQAISQVAISDRGLIKHGQRMILVRLGEPLLSGSSIIAPAAAAP